VDDERSCVRLSEDLVQWAIEQAPRKFNLYGSDPDLSLEIGGDQVCFAALDQALKSRTVRGRVGPTLYKVMKGKEK
jgi:trimethylamine:corrinoid methyltransferase-like protein